MSDTEQQLTEARTHLKALVIDLEDIGAPLACGCAPCTGQCRSHTALEAYYESVHTIAQGALGKARAFLKRTEPKHPVEVEWEKWWTYADLDEASIRDAARKAALHFAKWGMDHAAELVVDGHPVHRDEIAKRIRDAADKLPTA